MSGNEDGLVGLESGVDIQLKDRRRCCAADLEKQKQHEMACAKLLKMTAKTLPYAHETGVGVVRSEVVDTGWGAWVCSG